MPRNKAITEALLFPIMHKKLVPFHYALHYSPIMDSSCQTIDLFEGKNSFYMDKKRFGSCGGFWQEWAYRTIEFPF